MPPNRGGGQVTTFMGVPQGGTLSPLLANVYLHLLDEWVKEKKAEFDIGKKRRINPIRDYQWQRGILTTSSSHHPVPYGDPLDPNFKRLAYVRYADDFIIGIIGSKDEAVKLKEQLSKFLETELHLKLHNEKTEITHWSKGVKFLGYKLSWPSIQYKAKIRPWNTWTVRRQIRLLVDRDRVLDRLCDFCTSSRVPVPNWKLLHAQQTLSNARVRVMLIGLRNYYILAEDLKRSIRYIAYLVRMSMAKMYAAKFRLHSVKKVFKAGGIYLNKPIGKKGYGAIK